MRTEEEIDKVYEQAHKLEIMLSSESSEALRVDDVVPLSLQVVMDGLDIPKPDKVKILDRVRELYV